METLQELLQDDEFKKMYLRVYESMHESMQEVIANECRRLKIDTGNDASLKASEQCASSVASIAAFITKAHLAKLAEIAKANAIIGTPTVGFTQVVDVNDTIRLKAKSKDAMSTIQRFGEWWFIQHGAEKGASWLLRSIQEQKRELPKKTIATMVIKKVNDPKYDITQVHKWPAEFSAKKYK